MSSGLRNQVPLDTISVIPITRTSTSSPQKKKQKMTLTQTYYVAHTARGKLSKEAAKGDHDLRLLVGHANLLDGLMLDLAHAEEEQENWFNQSVNSNTTTAEERKHIQWAETIPEEIEEAIEEEFYADSSDSDSDSDEEEEMSYAQPAPRRAAPASTTVSTLEVVEEDEDMTDDDFEDELTLTRTSSIHPPELLHDSDSDSDDESMPPSPPQTELQLSAFSEKQRQAIATTGFYQSNKSNSPASLPESDQASFFDEGYYLPQRQQTAIAAY